jgi:hypothetical protein
VSLDAEFCQAHGLGPKIETDQARCDSHDFNTAKSQNPIPRQFSSFKS